MEISWAWALLVSLSDGTGATWEWFTVRNAWLGCDGRWEGEGAVFLRFEIEFEAMSNANILTLRTR